MTPWLSILLPSINHKKRAKFLRSLGNTTSSFHGIEIIMDSEPGGVIKALERCTQKATAEWCWIANDDLVSESMNWDQRFQESIFKFDDQIAMFYPNDLLFMDTFACFPLLPLWIFKKLFPSPFQRYKIDDSVMAIFPDERKIYLEDVIFRHEVLESIEGYKTKSGKIYPSDHRIGRIDNMRFANENRKRMEIRTELCRRINLTSQSESQQSNELNIQNSMIV